LYGEKRQAKLFEHKDENGKKLSEKTASALVEQTQSRNMKQCTSHSKGLQQIGSSSAQTIREILLLIIPCLPVDHEMADGKKDLDYNLCKGHAPRVRLIKQSA